MADDGLPRYGYPLHFEQEIIEDFAESIGLQLSWVIVEKRSDLMPYLYDGKGDIIAANLTITEKRKKQINFTVPVETVDEQLVVRSNEKITRKAQLSGRTIAVHRSSAFYDTAKQLQKKIKNLKIVIVPEQIPTERIIDGVASKEYDMTIADSNLVKATLRFRSDIKAAFSLSENNVVAWGVRPRSQLLLKQLNEFLSQEKLANSRELEYKVDLKGIQQRKVLRVLTRNNASTYFLWRGELLGFEYELAKDFAKHLGVRLELVVPPQRDLLVPWLLQGKGDLIAASLTIDKSKEKQGIRYSRFYNKVNEVIVGRVGEKAIESLQDIGHRTIVVRRSSAYWQTLQRLKEQGISLQVEAAPEEMETEEIISKVAEGEYDLTIADRHIFEIELTWRDDVKQLYEFDEPVKHGWVVRKEDENLLNEVNAYLKKKYRGKFYNLLVEKYFKDKHRMVRLQKERVDGNSEAADQLSPYDDVVKHFAKQYQFDWRLIVAQMYQESRFDPRAKSWVGARGLMQVMPRTARQLGFKDLHRPEQGIHSGLKYMDWIRDRFEDDIPVKDRMWFVLAAYNAGVGHVRDARILARRMGWQSNRWFGHVEKAMLLLSRRKYARKSRHGYVRGREPVNYVKEISARYEAYLRITNSKNN
ncbi:MAG: transporter substrate-binding domain-containing protein [Gammaproteobacteria bacterium]|nr:transporter substrate-binding domain-containing protein [Gammaproteobacteria bacterium]